MWCSICGADGACGQLIRDDFIQLWSLEPRSLQHCSPFQNTVIIWYLNQGYLARMLTWQNNSLAFVSLKYKIQGQWTAASGSNSTIKLVCEFYVSYVTFFILWWYLCFSSLLRCMLHCNPHCWSDDIYRALCPYSVEKMSFSCLWSTFVISRSEHVTIIV